AARNLPASVAGDILRQLGGGIATQRLYDVYAALQQRTSIAQVQRLVGENGIIPYELHNVAKTTIGSNYQYVVRTDITANQQEDFLTVSSDVPLSPGQIRVKGANLFNSENYKDEQLGFISPDEVVIVEANVADYVTP
ncbi:MAG TPA: hypothetical protein VF772_13765, partial [Terriglobales bacterium]